MRLLQLLRSLCYKVIIIILLFEIFVKEAWLNSLIVLVFSTVIAVCFAQNRMEINLADFHACIYTNRLYAEHFKRPVAGKTNVSEPCGHMDEESQPSDGRTAFQHRNEALCFRVFPCPSQVEFIRLEHDSLFRNMEQLAFIPFLHVQFMVVIYHELVRRVRL